MEYAQQNKIIDLNYVDYFDYKFIIVLKVDVFKSYVNITHIDEASLMFEIYYSKSQWKRNNLLIVISHTNFKMRGLELLFKIVILPR
jgi:hypothetical protein